ncbi:MAG: hypothetical protein K2X27_20020 [Candidatus Obscuribacterales bacterium]|nr:hypothetical protein [Candidatus Obscuribacterales bacterium]
MRRSIQIITIISVVVSGYSAQAQSPGGRLGDATITPGESSKIEPYGIKDSFSLPDYDKYFLKSDQRNDGGIGSSSFGTTSATISNSNPLKSYTNITPISSPISSVQDANRPRSFSERMSLSPALGTASYLTPISPARERLDFQDYNSDFGKAIPYNFFWRNQHENSLNKLIDASP